MVISHNIINNTSTFDRRNLKSVSSEKKNAQNKLMDILAISAISIL